MKSRNLLSLESIMSFLEIKYSCDTQEDISTPFHCGREDNRGSKTYSLSFRVERSGIEESFEFRIEMPFSDNNYSCDTQEISPLRFTAVEKTIADPKKTAAMSFRVERSGVEESFELRIEFSFLEIKYSCDTQEDLSTPFHSGREDNRNSKTYQCHSEWNAVEPRNLLSLESKCSFSNIQTFG